MSRLPVVKQRSTFQCGDHERRRVEDAYLPRQAFGEILGNEHHPAHHLALLRCGMAPRAGDPNDSLSRHDPQTRNLLPSRRRLNG